MNKTRESSRGLTLIEVVVSTLLVSTILLASLNASATFQRNQSAARERISGRELGNQILDEITCRDFRDRVEPGFGVEADESTDDRGTFDDVDDYHLYSESTPTHRDGSKIAIFDGWSYSISVLAVEADTNGITTSGASIDSPMRLIVVQCTSPSGDDVDSGALVCDRGTDALETTSYEVWRRVRLTFSDREIDVTTPLRNQPEPTP